MKELCIIHDTSEELICAQLLSYASKWENKDLSIEFIEQFQTECLDKKAIIDQRKALKSTKVHKKFESNIGFKQIEDIKALRQQFINDSNDCSNLKPTTKVFILKNDCLFICLFIKS